MGVKSVGSGLYMAGSATDFGTSVYRRPAEVEEEPDVTPLCHPKEVLSEYGKFYKKTKPCKTPGAFRRWANSVEEGDRWCCNTCCKKYSWTGEKWVIP